MDEKTDVLPSKSEDCLPLPAAEPESGTDTRTDTDIDAQPEPSTDTDSKINELLSKENESFESAAPTEFTNSTDTVGGTLSTTEILNSDETSTTNVLHSEAIDASVNALISSDALSVADALTNIDDLPSAEELTSVNIQPQTSADAELAEKSALNKLSSGNSEDTAPVVCELEEELKRLHEGDPVPIESKPEEKSVENVSHTEDKVKTTFDIVTKKPFPCTDTPVKLTLEQKPALKPQIEKKILKEVAPTEMLSADVARNPIVIMNAQEDLKKIDVLVCGICHEVFHFIEEFQLHKLDTCKTKSTLFSICEGETKPQVWGFTLWKNGQHKLVKTGEPAPSSWSVYQKWCKLPQSDKDAWIIAGQTLQYCSKVGNAKVTEVKPSKIQSKQVERDPLALDGFSDSNKENSVMVNAEDVIKKNIIKPVKLNNDVTILPSNKSGDQSNSNKAIRTVRSTEKREYVVERIVAKRYNPKRKMWEYQIKWENFSSEENTWEPISNLNHCKQMVEEFEEQLRKLKAEKAKQQSSGILAKGRGRPLKTSSNSSSPTASSSRMDYTPGRPTRTSKQKALNQVKAWCGNISEDEGGIKRSFEDDDSDDSFEKKMKYEEYSDDSDTDSRPKLVPLRKIAPKPTVQIIKNGIGKTSPIPPNVLIPDANGVVRINQKQLPSLSTGVYIMSKTAGIIKLDSTTSKVATSGGQTIVKVAPKIGQTQIKIVKKDGATTTTKQIIQMNPTKSLVNAPTTPTKVIKSVTSKMKKPDTLLKPTGAPKVSIKPKEEVKPDLPPPEETDSDDGLEELPFPDDIPLPEPPSPPGEFVLDPVTGKIAGVEYPEPEPVIETLKFESEDSSLENIVKLAAADITEEDLKTEIPMETDSVSLNEEEEEEDVEIKPPKQEPVVVRPPIVINRPSTTAGMRVTMKPTYVRSEPTLLNKPIGGSQILRKSLLNTSPQRPQPRVQQKILNHSISRGHNINSNSVGRGHNVSSIKTFTHNPNVVRTKPVAPRPKYNIAGPSKIIKSQHEVSPRNVYSKTPIQHGVTRKIGSTTIRSTNLSPQKPPIRIIQTGTNVHKVSPRKDSLLNRSHPSVSSPVIPKPRTVISMPSLIADDEPIISHPPPVAAKLPTAASAPTVVMPENSPEEETVPEPPQENEPSTAETATGTVTDISSFTLADNENPIFITGDDGTVYQVAGQNEQGQTILLTQGSDGQQQCLLVTNEVAESMETSGEEIQTDISMPEVADTSLTEPLSIKTDTDNSDQVVAQVVRAEPPSPGGTHKVVVMLPDGNLMVTQVSPEEYASLELD